MRYYNLSLFDGTHRILATSLIIAALALITGSPIVGTADNLPGLAMLFTAIILVSFLAFSRASMADYTYS